LKITTEVTVKIVQSVVDMNKGRRCAISEGHKGLSMVDTIEDPQETLSKPMHPETLSVLA